MSYPVLENAYAALIPLRLDHFELLRSIALEVDLYQYGPSDISTENKLKQYIDSALADAKAASARPYIIFDKKQQRYAGSTRFGHIDPHHHTVHIGWTWLGTDFRGSGINTHIKYLMLNHAFSEMDMEKVSFRIDERNTRSRRAVEKLGATLEGVLRQNMIVKDGFRRSTACYGILRSEWPSLQSTHFPNMPDK